MCSFPGSTASRWPSASPPQADPPAVVLISSRGADAFRRRLPSSPARGFIAKAELSGECLSSLLA